MLLSSKIESYLIVTALAAILKKHPNITIAAIVEPHALPPLVLNRDLSSCQQDTVQILDGIAYAMRSLNLPNVNMYLDLGHGGALGWKKDTRKWPRLFSAFNSQVNQKLQRKWSAKSLPKPGRPNSFAASRPTLQTTTPGP